MNDRERIRDFLWSLEPAGDPLCERILRNARSGLLFLPTSWFLFCSMAAKRKMGRTRATRTIFKEIK